MNYRWALGRWVAPHALKERTAKLDCCRQHMQLGVLPRNKRPVFPNELGLGECRGGRGDAARSSVLQRARASEDTTAEEHDAGPPVLFFLITDFSAPFHRNDTTLQHDNSTDTGSERMYHTHTRTCSELQYPTPRHPSSPSGLSPTASRQERPSGIALLCSAIARGSGLLCGLCVCVGRSISGPPAVTSTHPQTVSDLQWSNTIANCEKHVRRCTLRYQTAERSKSICH